MFFGELLLNENIITSQQLDEGLKLQKELQKPIGETLVHLEYLEKSELDKYLEIHILQCADQIVEDVEFRKYL